MRIMRGIAVEFTPLRRSVLATSWVRPVIPVPKIEAMIHVAMEALGAVEPGSGTDEYASAEPLGAVVAIGRTVIGRNFVIPVGALGRRPDIHTHRDLWSCIGSGCKKQPCCHSGKNYLFQRFHGFNYTSAVKTCNRRARFR